MAIRISKPAINLRDKLSQLDLPTGTTGVRLLATSTPTEVFSLLTGGNVGIGTDNPGVKLDVIGDIRSSTALRTIKTQLADEGAGGLLQTTGYLRISNGNSEFIRLSSTGNVGIGTNNPVAILNPHGTAALTNTAQTVVITDSNADDANGRGGNLGFSAYVNGSPRSLAAIGGLKSNDGNSFNGDLAFYTRTNGQASLDERLRIIYNGNVGIGTTNPVEKLEVFGKIYVRGQTTSDKAKIRFGFTNGVIQSGKTEGNIGSDYLSISGNGGTRDDLIVNYTGNVGIGITNPNEKLHVIGKLKLNNGGNTWLDSTSTGFLVANSSNIRLEVNSAERARLTSDGYLGIGTTNPQSLLHIKASTPTIRIEDNVGSADITTNTNAELVIRTNQESPIRFYAGATENVRIDDTGFVGIGTYLPANFLHIYGNTNPRVRIQSSSTSASGIELVNTAGSATSYIDTSANLKFFLGGDRVTFTQTGNVGIGTTDPGAKIDVVGTSRFTLDSTYLILRKTTETDYLGLRFDSSSGAKSYIGLAGQIGHFASGTVQHDLVLRSETNAIFTSGGGTPRIYIKSDGNVGIGNTNPGYKLDIQNNVADLLRLYNTNSSVKGTYITLNDTTYAAKIGHYEGDVQIWSGSIAGDPDVTIKTNGNVGIGTTNPYSRLSVSNGLSTRSGITISDGNTASVMIFAGASQGATISTDSVHQELIFKRGSNVGTENGSETMRITGTGNVGIGTNNPSQKLTVWGGDVLVDGSATATLTVGSGSYGGPHSVNVVGGGVSINNGYALNGILRLYNSTSNTASTYICPAAGADILFTNSPGGGELIRIKNNGRVGIGTGDPSYRLDINTGLGKIGFTSSGSGGSQIIFSQANGTARASIYNYGGAEEILAFTAVGNHQFLINNEFAAIINSSKYVGIGTNNPVAKLHVAGGRIIVENTSDPAIEFRDGSGSQAGFFFHDSTYDNLVIRHADVSGENHLVLTNSGNIGIGTTNPDGQLTIRKQILVTDTISNTVSHLSLLSDGGGSNPHQSVIHFGPRNASTNSSPAAIAAIASGNTASDLAFYVNTNNNYSGTPNTEVLRISNSGNVGINTYPADSLDILGGFRVQGNIRTRNYYKTGTTGEQQYTLKDTLANSAFEGDPLCHPFLMNDLASFIARGGSYAFSGLTSIPGGLGQLFSTQGHVYFDNSWYSGSTFTITLTNLPRNLNYGTFIGITFGSAAFSPSSCKIETSDNGGGTWTTRLDHTGSQFNYFTRVDASGSGINAIRYTIGQGNSGGVRIQSLWGFNYNSHGMEHYFMPRSGGPLYGNMSFPSGNGIDFSADANAAGMTSELLDDYEEGTWTPTFTGSTTPGTPVYPTNSRAGKYTKIGNYVQVQAYIEVTNIGGAVGNIVITGLPFLAELSFFGASGIGTGHASGSLGNSVRIYNNNTIAELRNNNATVSVTTGQIYLSFGYRVF